MFIFPPPWVERFKCACAGWWCICVYVPVCRCTSCPCMGCWMFFSVTPHLFFILHSVSHWTWSLEFQLDWLTSELPKFAYLCPPSSGVRDPCCPACLFMQVLGMWNQVLMVTQKVFTHDVLEDLPLIMILFFWYVSSIHTFFSFLCA